MVDVKETIATSSRIAAGLLDQSQTISDIAEAIIETLKNGGKLIIFGNGGSAAQAQHLSAELVVRVEKRREACPAVALTTDSATLTAAANDFGFHRVFSRQIEALARSGDVALALSTSGNSPNVVSAIETAKTLNLKTIALLGKDGGEAKGLADIELIVRSKETQRIQEAHLLVLHIIAESVEDGITNQ